MTDLSPCPFCNQPPGTKVGPPALARCIAPDCLGAGLAAKTFAEWNVHVSAVLTASKVFGYPRLGSWLHQPLDPAHLAAAEARAAVWCEAFLRAYGDWVEPHKPATEDGVQVEMEITAECAAELNAETVGRLRESLKIAWEKTRDDS